MKTSSFRIYLITKLVRNKEFFILLIAAFWAIFCLPHISSLASFQLDGENFVQRVQEIIASNFHDEPKTMRLYVTAYSSTPEETDDTPCIASSGYNLCKHDKENVVACNFLPFGTKIKFPELDPDKVYIVVDRMHERYNSRVDIWMRAKSDARTFGKKYLTVEIYK
jgi:3D (Asp-Asp-Asp) domain-containing protein